MQKSVLFAAIQREIHQHDFSHFVDEPPSLAQGGRRSRAKLQTGQSFSGQPGGSSTWQFGHLL